MYTNSLPPVTTFYHTASLSRPVEHELRLNEPASSLVALYSKGHLYFNGFTEIPNTEKCNIHRLINVNLSVKDIVVVSAAHNS